MECFLQRDRALEVRHSTNRDVCAIEDTLDGGALHARALQHVSKPYATPPSVADSALRPLQPGDRRIIKSASVARAFEYPDQFMGRHPAQILHRECERRRNASFNLQPPVCKIHLRYGDMSSNEKVLDGDRKSTRLNSSHVRISYAVF